MLWFGHTYCASLNKSCSGNLHLGFSGPPPCSIQVPYPTVLVWLMSFYSACQCSVLGSYQTPCNPVTGQCECQPGITGQRCDRCLSGAYDFPHCQGREDIKIPEGGLFSGMCAAQTSPGDTPLVTLHIWPSSAWFLPEFESTENACIRYASSKESRNDLFLKEFC